MKERELNYLSNIAALLSVLSILYLVWILISWSIVALSGLFSMDTPLYWVVGRGWTESLIPYKDLFELKPPGIFFIAATSWYFFKSMIVMHVFQSFITSGWIVYGLIVAIYFVKQDNKHKNYLLFLAIASVLALLSLAIYATKFSGHLQTESFGSFFGTLFVILCFLLGGNKNVDKKYIFLLGLTLAIATSFKEPFFITALGGGLLFSSTRRNVLQTIFFPTALAIFIGTFMMFLFGILIPYVSIYLPVALSERTNIFNSFYRILELKKPLEHLYEFAPILCITLLTCIGMSLSLSIYRKKFFHTLKIVTCFLITVYAVRLSDWSNFNHHYIVAVPCYVAFFLFCFDNLLTERAFLFKQTFIFFCIALLILSSFQFKPKNINQQKDFLKRKYVVMERKAQAIDTILDHCNIERYLYVGKNGLTPYALSKHIPQGPVFAQMKIAYLNQYLYEKFVQSFYKVDIILAKEVPLNQLLKKERDLKEYINAHFSKKPWPCAENINKKSLHGYVLYYRKS